MFRAMRKWWGFVVRVALACAVAVPAIALELDRRRMLTPEEHAAWKAVGRVNIASFDERGMCTGTLIGEDLVLTAAHCVVSARTGKLFPPGNVHFVAGWRQGKRVAYRKARKIVVHPKYDRSSPPDLQQIGSDLALIRLTEPIPATTAPFFKVAPTPPRDVPLTLISYRRDRAHALTRQEGCQIEGAAPRVLKLGCDVTFGASGSPLFAEIQGERRLIAVISAMSKSKGSPVAWAVRVDAAIGEVLAKLE